MMEDKKPLVLVYGSTGKTGVHISNLLVAEGFPVRIFCRSKEKVTKVFEEKEIGFEKIVEGSLEKEEDMKKAFDVSESYGPVGIVVSALGKGPGSGPSI
jgi:nucleoside-diphosphate-sugar epimerase